MNMTILEHVRRMLLGVSLPKSFWGEVANIVMYLINRCSSLTLNFKTPIKKWSCKLAT
uniref:Retrovirus-related Pol polyprotein from transposon TNT 1-94 n=1 Tax=Cajanus cajan TaxID=3821 RepID=A0A151S343_CAJCA|nr:Retrovirus-related Pol polyprotein from transposon TNT 1-94 [Cajanus cajan]